MLKLLVIADDFTGALDTGVQFSNRGAETLVTTNLKVLEQSIPNHLDVIVIDTESRYIAKNEAYDLIETIMHQAKKQNIPYIYKKVDSALRGNISHEIKAIVDSEFAKIIPFIPAYPEINRIVKNGHLYIDDQLVSESIFAEDPYEPVKESNIVKRLLTESGVPCQLIQNLELESLNEGLVLFDTESTEKLSVQMDFLSGHQLTNLMVGCASGANALADKLFGFTKVVTPSIKLPLVVVCGSVNQVTKNQIEYSEGNGYPRISLGTNTLLAENYWNSESGKNDLEIYRELISKHDLVMFESLSEKTFEEIESLLDEGVFDAQMVRFKIGESFGHLTEKLWQSSTEATYLFTGGDTLFRSMKVLGVTEIHPIVEISQGVVLSEIHWEGKKLKVITKSGGFGNKELFTDSVKLGRKERVFRC